jgi:hypothetical protein
MINTTTLTSLRMSITIAIVGSLGVGVAGVCTAAEASDAAETVAAAQSDSLGALYVSAANVPTGISGVHTFPAPPQGFNPVSASDAERITYGFPPRPDQQADPDHYAMWERAMLAAKIRANGEFKPLPAAWRMTKPAAASPMAEIAQAEVGPTRLSTINASGVQLTNKLRAWSRTASFNDIWTLINVPKAQVPFANGTGCTASDYFSDTLAGIDARIASEPSGWVVYPELAGGVVADTDCVDGTTQYYAVGFWGTSIAPFTLNPGDIFYTEVHASGPGIPGWVFLEDETTLSFGTYTLAPDESVPLVGNSAQWVVWRPCCGNSSNQVGAWPLANDIEVSFDGASVQNDGGKIFYPGSQANSTYVLTMTDDYGTQDIELVNQGNTGYQGLHSLFFETTGCAYAGGCFP